MMFLLSGFAGSGKDTFAKYLCRYYKYNKISFAEPLKKCISEIFHWDYEMVKGETKESRIFRNTDDLWWSSRLNQPINPRFVLQKVGTDMLRKEWSDIWIASTERKLLNHLDENVVITDCRFSNEIHAMKKLCKKNKTPLYHIEIIKGSKNPDWVNYYRNTGNDICIPQDIHKSEIDWLFDKRNNSSIYPDFIFCNDGTIHELELQISNFMNKINE